MKIRKYSTLSDGVYKISLVTEDWSEADQRLMLKFGEPEVDLGGTFGIVPDTYTLPTNLVRIMSEAPFTQSFDSRDHADADARAILWKETVSDRIAAAIVALRTSADAFSGEEVENV